MLRLGINTGAELATKSLPFLQQQFAKAGSYFFGIARGIDHRPVRVDRILNSAGAEATFEKDLEDFEPLRVALLPIIDKVWRHCEANNVRGRTVTLKVKFSDFSLISRSRSATSPVNGREQLEAVSIDLLRTLMPVARTIRLLGISVSGLDGSRPDRQRTLFEV